MEDGGDVGADADSEEHVTELADRRVSQHLDVVLGDGDGGGEQCRAHPWRSGRLTTRRPGQTGLTRVSR